LEETHPEKLEMRKQKRDDKEGGKKGRREEECNI
jgi:hypothetical protein